MRLSCRAVIAYRRRQKHNGRNHANRSSGSRRHGRQRSPRGCWKSAIRSRCGIARRKRPSRWPTPAPRSPATPAEVAAASEAVITMLTDGAAIEAVYNGPNGLLSGDVKGKLFIEMSTVAPKVETDLAPKVRAKGAALVECPVGGSTAPARKGQLLGLMGAEPADAARAQADPRSALPQGRALRAGRHRRGDEARDQSAADGGLAGLWRSLCHRAQRRLGAQAPARPVRREQRRQQRARACAPT